MTSRLLLAVAFAAFLQGCQSTDGQGRFATTRVGLVDRDVEATVEGVDALTLRRGQEGGAAIGGGIGGGLSSGSDDAAVILVGIVAGAIVGSAVESASNNIPARRYTLRTSNGAQLVAIQPVAGFQTFALGDKVLVHYGSPITLSKAH